MRGISRRSSMTLEVVWLFPCTMKRRVRPFLILEMQKESYFKTFRSQRTHKSYLFPRSCVGGISRSGSVIVHLDSEPK